MIISEVFAAVNEISKFHAVSYSMLQQEEMAFPWTELLNPEDFIKLYKVSCNCLYVNLNILESDYKTI